MLRYLFKKSNNVHGISISKDEVLSARERYPGFKKNIIEGDICKLSYKDNEFDYVVCLDVLSIFKSIKKL